MSSGAWIIILCVLFLLIRHNRMRDEQALRQVIRKRRKKGKREMSEFVKGFIGKECLLYTMNSGQITGVIKSVSDGAALLETKDGAEVVNLDYIVRIREYPKNKNGKKKSMVLD